MQTAKFGLKHACYVSDERRATLAALQQHRVRQATIVASNWIDHSTSGL